MNYLCLADQLSHTEALELTALLLVLGTVLALVIVEALLISGGVASLFYYKGRFGWFPRVRAEAGDVLRARRFGWDKRKYVLHDVIRPHRKWFKVIVKPREGHGKEIPFEKALSATDLFSTWTLIKPDGRTYAVSFGYLTGRELRDARVVDANFAPPIPT